MQKTIGLYFYVFMLKSFVKHFNRQNNDPVPLCTVASWSELSSNFDITCSNLCSKAHMSKVYIAHSSQRGSSSFFGKMKKSVFLLTKRNISPASE